MLIAQLSHGRDACDGVLGCAEVVDSLQPAARAAVLTVGCHLGALTAHQLQPLPLQWWVQTKAAVAGAGAACVLL